MKSLKNKFLILFIGVLALIFFIPSISSAASADLSSHMPPVKSQGGYGSCVGWATAYYYKTFQEKMEHGWNVNTANHQFSPSFVWNQVNGGRNSGTYFEDAYDVIKAHGNATLSSMPYTHYGTWPNHSQWENGMWYRGQDYQEMSTTNLTGLKNHLDSGDVFNMGVPVYSDSLGATGGNDVHDGPRGGYFRGGHAITIVGYDDNRSYTDASGRARKGAFKWVNSWGSTWSGNGYSWLSYRFVVNSVWEAWKMTDRINYQPLAWVKVDITHPYRYQLDYKVGSGSPGNYDFQRYFLYHEGGFWPDIHASHDITDGADYLPPNNLNKWYLKVRDIYTGYQGTLDNFEVVYAGNTYSTQNLPATIRDGFNGVTVYIAGSKEDNDPPTQPTISITPEEPKTNQNITCEGSGSTDPNEDQITYRYQWYKNGIVQPGQNSATVSRLETAKGQTWKCVVTPTDGWENGPTNEAEVTVVNAPPIIRPISAKTFYAGIGRTLQITAFDPDPRDNLVFSASNLPAGSAFNTLRRIFAWKPTLRQLGIHDNIRIQVTDGQDSDADSFYIKVVKPPDPTPAPTPTTPNWCKRARRLLDYNDLIRPKGGGTVAIYRSCKKYPILSWRVFNQRGYKWSRIKNIDRSLFRLIQTKRLLVYKNGTLLRATGSNVTWVIQKQKRHCVTCSAMLRKLINRLPASMRKIIRISHKELRKISYGGIAYLTIELDSDDAKESLALIEKGSAQLVSKKLYQVISGDEQELEAPVEVSLKYDPKDLPDNVDENSLVAMMYDGNSKWNALPTIVKPDKNLALAEASGLHPLGLFAYAKGSEPITISTPYQHILNWQYLPLLVFGTLLLIIALTQLLISRSK